MTSVRRRATTNPPVIYTIIGDTSASFVEAQSLLTQADNSGTQILINILIEGADRTNTNLSEVDYAALNYPSCLKDMITERVMSIPQVIMTKSVSPEEYVQTQDLNSYNVGKGPLGDMVATYFIPRCGPWFNKQANTGINKFVNDTTITQPFTTSISVVANSIAARLGLAKVTNTVRVDSPSILMNNKVFVTPNVSANNNIDNLSRDFVRNIFLSTYHSVCADSRVTPYYQVQGMQFTKNSDGTYDICVMKNDLTTTLISGTKLRWSTNGYTYLRLATNGGLNVKQVPLPVAYKFSTVIPLVNPGGADLVNGSDDFGDGVTSCITFSVSDISSRDNKSIAWTVIAYTTAADLYPVSANDIVTATDSANYTTLNIEALCFKNKRNCQYDTTNQWTESNYNSYDIESKYERNFKSICAAVLSAYTNVVHSETDISTNDAMDGEGARVHRTVTTNLTFRQFPMSVILDLLSEQFVPVLNPITPANRI